MTYYYLTAGGNFLKCYLLISILLKILFPLRLLQNIDKDNQEGPTI